MKTLFKFAWTLLGIAGFVSVAMTKDTSMLGFSVSCLCMSELMGMRD